MEFSLVNVFLCTTYVISAWQLTVWPTVWWLKKRSNSRVWFTLDTLQDYYRCSLLMKWLLMKQENVVANVYYFFKDVQKAILLVGLFITRKFPLKWHNLFETEISGNFDVANVCRIHSIASCNILFFIVVGIMLRHANHMQNDVKDSRIEIVRECTSQVHTYSDISICGSLTHSFACIAPIIC